MMIVTIKDEWGRYTTLTMLCCVVISCAYIGEKYSGSIPQLLSALKVDSEQRAPDLAQNQISSADSVYALHKSKYSVVVEELKSQKMGRSAFVVGDWYFRSKQFDKASFFYRLALSDTFNFSNVHCLCISMANVARSRIDLINNNQDFGRKPLGLYAEAVTGSNHIQNRRLLERIKEKYPKSSIIDDVDFKIGTYMYPRDRTDLAKYWEDFLARYPQSPLCAKARRGLTIVYYNLGIEKSENGDVAEAEKYYRYVLERPPVFEHYSYVSIAKFFEERGKLDLAKQAYQKGLHLGWPDAYAALGLFYEEHYNLERYIEFLKKSGTSEHDIRRRLNYLKEMRQYIE